MQKRLYRSCKDVMLGGVAGGVAEYFEVDPTLVRLVMALVLISGFGFVAYILAWIIIPLDPSCNSKKTAADEIKEKAEKTAEEIKNTFSDSKKKEQNSEVTLWIGLGVLFLGLMLLAQNIIGFNFWHNFWPIIFIVGGIIIMSGTVSTRK
jgi:phage shock protein PspC (stress-responsive transcriptional regulator)